MATIILICLNVLASYQGFRSEMHFDRYVFHVDRILTAKEYPRIISSGFLHGNWMHLILNMVSLLSLGFIVESQFGLFGFLLIYFASMILGGLLSLYIHRNHGDYRAVGASGAVSGVLFAVVVLAPRTEIFFIEAWIMGVAFVIFSLYGIKNNYLNIGHDAHLGGAMTGVLFAILLQPSLLVENWWVVLLCTVPTAVFMYLVIRFPEFLLIDNFFKKRTPAYKKKKDGTIPLTRSKELDNLLDKINKVGYDGLSSKEKERLRDLSNR